MEFRLSFSGERNGYRISLAPNAEEALLPVSETAYYWDKSYPQPYDVPMSSGGKEAAISKPGGGNVVQYVKAHLDRWRVYHFHDTSYNSPLKRNAEVNDNRFLRSDGSNLPAFLYYLKQKHSSSYMLIVGVIRRVAPFFADFQLEPLALNQDIIRLEWKHIGSDRYFDVASMSDGTVRFVALATLLLQPVEFRPSVILVDEPELGLHPYAITMLASMIKQASVQTQVIVSTQSSFFLDNFRPEDVLVADRVNGGTEMSRLQSENLSGWLEKYSLGQLWEAGEFNGRPNIETEN